MSQVWYLHITQSEISQERGKITNFGKRSYQPILRYLYVETIKRLGKISLHRHFKQRSVLAMHEAWQPGQVNLYTKPLWSFFAFACRQTSVIWKLCFFIFKWNSMLMGCGACSPGKILKSEVRKTEKSCISGRVINWLIMYSFFSTRGPSFSMGLGANCPLSAPSGRPCLSCLRMAYLLPKSFKTLISLLS